MRKRLETAIEVSRKNGGLITNVRARKGSTEDQIVDCLDRIDRPVEMDWAWSDLIIAGMRVLDVWGWTYADPPVGLPEWRLYVTCPA